jgi:uncharacterized protein involved in type VI secretion and phage assembly
MPSTLEEMGADSGRGTSAGYSIVIGRVTGNLDLLRQGKIECRIPSMDQEVWARLTAPGAGKNAGLFYVPRQNDEVLLALNRDEPTDAFLLGGVWSTTDPPPITDPVTGLGMRVFRTGMGAGLAHEVEFNDLKQSVTVKTSTGQKVTLDPLKIELTNTAGTLTISMNNTTQSIKISAAAILELSAAQVKISGQSVQISGNVLTEIKGTMVKIN